MNRNLAYRLPFIAAALGASLTTLAALPTPAMAATFDGPYVGINAGWNRTEVDEQVQPALPVDAEAGRDAGVVGIHAGYNFRAADRVVLGVEGGVSVPLDDSQQVVSSGSPLTLDARYSFDLGARAGYLVTPKTLLYVRGGYAGERVRTTLSTEAGYLRNAETLDAWTVGGGVEHEVVTDVTARIEYRYADFGTDGGTYDRHQALVGVSYHF